MYSIGTLHDHSIALFETQMWQDMLTAIRSENFESLATLLQKSRKLYKRQVGWVRKSECSHYAEITLELSAGDTLQFQLTTDVFRGFLVPFVQLWCVAPGFDVCLQHTEKPIDCFSAYATLPSKDKYKHTAEYSKVWMPMSAMESASCAVAENDSIVIHDVKITWAKQRTSKGQLQGTFCLNKSFLDECSIEVDFNHCYLCIRLSGLKNMSLNNKDKSENKLVVDPDTYTWVAHGVTEEFNDNQKSDRTGLNTLNFYINYMSMENVPAEISQPSASFTVELIPKMLPDIRKENAIWRLQHASELAKSIALGHEPPKKGRSVTKSKLLQQKSFDLPGSKRKLNDSQRQAILNALKKPFTLIQGPPGTGKTVVGSHIVYWFHKLNEETSKNEQVPPSDKNKPQKRKCILYCGPSNKSVDVVAGNYLLALTSLANVTSPCRHVWCAALEKKLLGSLWGRYLCIVSLFREIILHHRIRRPQNPFWQVICSFDTRVKEGKEITEAEIKR
uniref:DNA2/NAM7 helicase helicase domain-containing protein n=1 Tax=Anas platyrhynchos TaxID=8839 RepID=A0A8B9TC47_ANAPL